jgi:hypothetical protein
MRVASGDLAVDQHNNAGGVAASAIGHFRLDRVETVSYATHGNARPRPDEFGLSSLSATSRNPKFGAAAGRFAARSAPIGRAGAVWTAEFSNDSRKLREQSNKLLTNGNIT